MIDDIAKKITEEKNNLIAQAFTMQIGKLLISNGIVPIMKEYTLNDVKSIMDSDRYKIVTEFGVAFDELDTTEHDKQIRANVIDEFVNECVKFEDLTFDIEHIRRIKMIAEHLKEMNNED